MTLRWRSFGTVILLVLCGTMLPACGRLLRQNNPASATPAPAPTATAIASPTAPEPTAAPTASQPAVAPTLALATLAAPTLAPTSGPTAIVALKFKAGRNDYLLNVDDTLRKVLIYVPSGYNPRRPTAVVFMFHGSNQGGPLMYETTRWAAKADQENFIVVFPTSWHYRTLEENKIEDKWNVYRLYRMVVPGTELKDDVKFVRVMIDTLQATFNVDDKRLYASGFSNGGSFVLSRLLIEMHDVFAAFTTAGSGLWGEGQPDEVPTGINASVYSVLGSNDNKISEGTGHALPFPLIAEEIAADELFHGMLGNATTVLSLDMAYEAQYDRPWFSTLTFKKSLTGANNQYIFRMINNMGHVYPSGDNNRAGLDVAEPFWDFFRLYART